MFAREGGECGVFLGRCFEPQRVEGRSGAVWWYGGGVGWSIGGRDLRRDLADLGASLGRILVGRLGGAGRKVAFVLYGWLGWLLRAL